MNGATALSEVWTVERVWLGGNPSLELVFLGGLPLPPGWSVSAQRPAGVEFMRRGELGKLTISRLEHDRLVEAAWFSWRVDVGLVWPGPLPGVPLPDRWSVSLREDGWYETSDGILDDSLAHVVLRVWSEAGLIGRRLSRLGSLQPAGAS